MNIQQIMQLYNQYERRVIDDSNGRVETSPSIARVVSNQAYGSYIAYFDFAADQTDSQIQQQVDYFSNLGIGFEWKTYATDQPKNIESSLLAHGFVQEEQEAFMVLDIDAVESQPAHSAGLQRIKDEQGIRDAIQVQQQVWKQDFDWHYRQLCEQLNKAPESISIYVMYDSGQPVSSAWITFKENSPFAGIWGGSTVPSHRCRGHYSALLQQRIHEAKSRGKRYLTIDASDMSQPIVAKSGFQLITHTRGYSFNPS
ncbi:GNAT family N-acetyltransferase [Bacterioplanes sanyensis]|uniref:GNAT family N-acetyltransferase n=1 Tax=Bacterioplanes sanyensis TaxID=1249553 RepID=A0A222FPU6_9GAMM|nr:GNAT family N-acetyltransferase [Bacterioplanes sanyensis]